jgi:hypothetical protein
MHLPRWDWQEKTLIRARPMPHYALLAKMGCGKTREIIDILRDKYNQHRRILRTVVFAPIMTLDGFRNQMLDFSKIEPERILVLEDQPPKRRAKLWDKMMEKWGGNFIVVLNYEKILSKDIREMIRAWAPEVVVCDESHYIKDYGSKRTKLMIKLVDGQRNKKTGQIIRPPVQYRYIMTGTPGDDVSVDIWAQYRVLDGGQRLGRTFTDFKLRYFYNKNAEKMAAGVRGVYPEWVPLPGALEKINALIYQCATRVLLEDCYDLPPLIRKQVYVGMTSEQQAAYNEMKRDFVTYLEGTACVADMALTKAMRLSQIASGYAKLEDGREVVMKDTPKMAALRELVQEIVKTDKVLIWAHFQRNFAEIKKVLDELGVKYIELHGKAEENRREALARFRDDPEVRACVGNAATGGVGVNELVGAKYAIFYSRDYSQIKDEQARARNYRPGAEIHDQVVQIDIVCRGSVEQTILDAIEGKVNMAEAVLTWKDKV